MSVTVEVVNEGADEYWVDDLAITLAVPPHVAELLTFHGALVPRVPSSSAAD